MKKSKKKKPNKFFNIFNPKYLFMDFVRTTGWLSMQVTARPKYHYYGNAPKTRKIKGRALLACNHTDWIDPALISVAYIRRRVFVVTAKEGMSKGISQLFFRGIHCIPIDRTANDFTAFNKTVDLLKNDKTVLIFPEGRLSDPQSADTMPFKSGMTLMALRANAPIIPVYSPGGHKAFKRAHLVIGEPINLREHFDGQLHMQNIEMLTLVVQERMRELKDEWERISAEETARTENKKKKRTENDD